MKKNSTFFSFSFASIASLSGLLQSLVTCIIAGALFHISKEFSLSSFQEGNLASIILIGAFLGTLISGYLSDRIGRKKTLLLSSIIYMLCGISVYCVECFHHLMLIRFITGIAVGITSISCPLYLTEIASPSNRGAFVTGFQLAITVGTLVAYIVNASFFKSENWKGMFFFAFFPALLQFVGLWFLPESPKWLWNRGRKTEALEASLALHQTIKQQEKIEKPKKYFFLFNRSLLKAILLGLGLCAFQQFCGINAIIYFAPKIFKEVGFSLEEGAKLPLLILGIIAICFTLLSLFLVDRLGRKKLLLMSAAGLILSFSIFLLNFLSLKINYISLLAILFYVGCFSIGIGPITWVVVSELYPLPERAKSMAIMAIIGLCSNYLVILSFPYFMSKLGIFITFTFYLVSSILALFFYCFFIPETKGKKLEDLENMFYPNYKKS